MRNAVRWRAELNAEMSAQIAAGRPAEDVDHEDVDEQEAPEWVVMVAAVLVSIPLGLCCYLLLKL